MAKFRVGDRVLVPWGLDEVPGTVVDLFGPPGAPFVTVRVDLSGTDEDVAEDEVGFKASDIRMAPATTSN